MSSSEPKPTATNELVTSKRGIKSTFDSLSVRNYRYYWMGSLASFFAGQMQQPTQAWLAFQLTNSPLLLGLTWLCQGIPQLLIAPIGGFVIDRVQKRSLIMITQTVTLILNLTVAILISLGLIQYWHILVTSFLTGANSAFNMPARNSIVAELVPREKMYNAIALNNGGSNIARVAGPALAGILIGFIGTQGAYYVGVGFNAVAILTIRFLPPTSKLGLAGHTSVLSNLKEGFAYLKIHNIILILFCLEIVLTLFGMSYQGLMPVFADILHADAAQYGFMMSAVGIGALSGALGMASLGNFKKKGLVMVCMGITFGIMLILFSNTSIIGDFFNWGGKAYYISLLCLVFVGVSSTSYTATSLTIIQMYVSDEFRGRVTSIYQIVIALYPISIVISSAAAEVLGASLALTISGGLLALSMILTLTITNRVRNLE